MGIAAMLDASDKKHYSQSKSSVEINEEEDVPPPGGGIVVMAAATAMKKRELRTKNITVVTQ